MSIASWSHSKVIEFEKCGYRAYLLHDARVPEPQRPLAPGKTEQANDRGTRVHQGCEDFVRGLVDTPPPEALLYFEDEIHTMRNLHAHGCVSLEGEWGMNEEWEPWDWRGEWVEIPEPPKEALRDAVMVKELPERPKHRVLYGISKGKSLKFSMFLPPWLRLKLDALVFISPTEAIAIDYKTGKKWGNEIKHGEQLQLYQLVTFLRYPQLERITTELWYFDADELTSQTFTRMQGLRFKRSWNQRGTSLTTAQVFEPKPSTTACKWCMYGPWGSGHCKVGKK